MFWTDLSARLTSSQVPATAPHAEKIPHDGAAAFDALPQQQTHRLTDALERWYLLRKARGPSIG